MIYWRIWIKDGLGVSSVDRERDTLGLVCG